MTAMRWSPGRLATAAAVALWAALFWFIIATDRLSFYLASRTSWLAPVGAVTLTLATIGAVVTARTSHPEKLDKRRVKSLALLVVPAVAILLFPPATLGSYAVSRRSQSVKGAYVSFAGRDLSKGDLSLLDIFGLSYNNEIHRLATRAGSSSSFTGFVTRDPGVGADEFYLNRFMVTCCPGDAVSIRLRVVGAPPGQFKTDDWVRVTGKIYPVGKQVVVDATEVQNVSRPERPYLNQS